MGTDLRIVEGTICDKWDKVEGLLRSHVDELTTQKHLMILNPHKEAYESLEKSGKAFALFVYAGDDIVGYSVNFITKHLHYQDLLYMENDVLFVAKEHRKARVGVSLIQETERVAKREGAQAMLWHAKPDTTLCQLLPRMGYLTQDVLYMKEV